MNTVLWIIQGVAAAAFLGSGLAKALQPRERLAEQDRMSWVEALSDGQVRSIGALEAAGAVGLVLPWVLDIAPVLTPLAGLGLAVTMVGANVLHIRRNEIIPHVVINLVLGVLAGIVAVGRFVDL